MAAWDRANAAHLVRRTHFGASAKDIAKYVKTGSAEAALDKLFKLPRKGPTYGKKYPDLEEVQRWWLKRMSKSGKPFHEKLTLFLHDHFATSDRKVDYPRLMAIQNGLLRRGVGLPFDELLFEITRDPAMIRWLDNDNNIAGNPNENYSREFMELFCLGIAAPYTEQDVRELARVCTGWTTDGGVETTLRPDLHDFGSKTLLGQTVAPQGGDETAMEQELRDAISILVSTPDHADFLCRKLFEFFCFLPQDQADEDAASPVLSAMASAYAGATELRLETPLRVLFSDDLFYSDRAKRGLPRSPVDFYVGTVRSFKVKTGKWFEYEFLERMATQGMDLLRPPSVGGWNWGRSWISSMTLLERYDMAVTITEAAGGGGWAKFDPRKLLRGLPNDADSVLDTILELAGVDVGALDPAVRAVLLDYLTDAGSTPVDVQDEGFLQVKVRGLAYLALVLPEAQV